MLRVWGVMVQGARGSQCPPFRKEPASRAQCTEECGRCAKNDSGFNDLGKMLSLCSERGFRFNWRFGRWGLGVGWLLDSCSGGSPLSEGE